eukprot:INCI7203.5.p2 GENE.INCI7203.5~~INCI7203.5.p2  ORF type:complete len:413 (+),score=97.64 INCI7203.5:128-1240(+)
MSQRPKRVAPPTASLAAPSRHQQQHPVAVVAVQQQQQQQQPPKKRARGKADGNAVAVAAAPVMNAGGGAAAAVAESALSSLAAAASSRTAKKAAGNGSAAAPGTAAGAAPATNSRRNWPKKVAVILEKLDNLIRRHKATSLPQEEFNKAIPSSLRSWVKLEDLDTFPEHNLQFGKNVISVSATHWMCSLCEKSFDSGRISKVYKHLCSKRHKVRLLAQIAQFGPEDSQHVRTTTEIRNPFNKQNFVDYLVSKGSSTEEAEQQFQSAGSVDTRRRMIEDQLQKGSDDKFVLLEKLFWQEWCASNTTVAVVKTAEAVARLTPAKVGDFLARQMFQQRTINVETDPVKAKHLGEALYRYLTHAGTFTDLNPTP